MYCMKLYPFISHPVVNSLFALPFTPEGKGGNRP